MSSLTILAWAQAKTILGFDQSEVKYDPKETPRELMQRSFPEFSKLGYCRVAVDESIVDWDKPIGNAKELAIIPPVSGR